MSDEVGWGHVFYILASVVTWLIVVYFYDRYKDFSRTRHSHEELMLPCFVFQAHTRFSNQEVWRPTRQFLRIWAIDEEAARLMLPRLTVRNVRWVVVKEESPYDRES